MDVAVTRWLNAAAGGYPILDATVIGLMQFGRLLMALLVAVW